MSERPRSKVERERRLAEIIFPGTPMKIELGEYTDGLSNLTLIRHLLDRKDLTKAEKLVSICLAMHRNITTLKCCPSIKRIAEQTSLKRHTVCACIRSLEDKRVLEVRRGTRGMKGRDVNYYVFLFDVRAASEAENMNLDLVPEVEEILRKMSIG